MSNECMVNYNLVRVDDLAPPSELSGADELSFVPLMTWG